MWDLPRPGLEPVSPPLAGRLSTTAPPGKSQEVRFLRDYAWKTDFSLWGKRTRAKFFQQLPVFLCCFYCYCCCYLVYAMGCVMDCVVDCFGPFLFATSCIICLLDVAIGERWFMWPVLEAYSKGQEKWIQNCWASWAFDILAVLFMLSVLSCCALIFHSCLFEGIHRG